VDRLAYLAEMAAAQLDGTRHLILAGARARPVSVSYLRYHAGVAAIAGDADIRAGSRRAVSPGGTA